MEWLTEFLQSGVLPVALLILRVITPVLALYVVWRSYTSFQKGQRKRDPVITLWDEASGTRFPVLYWENSIGRSKSCDVYLPDATASRDHAVLLRRDEGWFICDTGSKSGVFVNGKKVDGRKLVNVGDKITMGSTTLSLWNSDSQPEKKRRVFVGFSRKAASPAKLMVSATLVHLLMAVQSCFAGGSFAPVQFVPFFIVLALGWGLYTFFMGIRHHVSFEIETVAYLLSGIGILLLAAYDIGEVKTQIAAMLLGMILFCVMLWFMDDMERVAKFRVAIGIGALALFALNLVIGREIYGAKNWIIIGPISFQPSELIKIAFIFVGTSTLDRLQTKKNITEFLVFTLACVGCLALMGDYGSAVVFFAGFLIIAFMRSGSVRTIALILGGACLGLMLVLKFKSHVIARFSLWGHVWDDMYGAGFQQTHTLTYIASGGLFGVGLGQGCMPEVPMGDSDLVFGLLCEEQGLFMGLVVLMAIAMFILYARSEVTRSRSTFFSIAACAAAGMLLFQTCLNVFGPVDVLPFTGVTLPFISSGGSSMISVWAMMAFLKASDERTYAARRASRHSSGNASRNTPPDRRGRVAGGGRPSGRPAGKSAREMEDIYS